jgi:hypothetical protein
MLPLAKRQFGLSALHLNAFRFRIAIRSAEKQLHQIGAGRAAVDRPVESSIVGLHFRSGTHSGKGDATMIRHFTPPMVVPIALLALIPLAIIARMQSGL